MNGMNEVEVGVFVKGRGKKPVQIALVPESRAKDMCKENNYKLFLKTGITMDELHVHPEFMFFTKNLIRVIRNE